MTSHSGRYVVTFNGEIFNYATLRRELDYPFKTDGDTEVLLALFERDGPRRPAAARSVRLRDLRHQVGREGGGAQHLPAEIVDRRKVVGVAVPLDAWFRHGLRDMAWDMLTSANSYVGGVMAPGAIRALLASHESGRRNEQVRLWTLLGLEVWHALFFRAEPMP